MSRANKLFPVQQIMRVTNALFRAVSLFLVFYSCKAISYGKLPKQSSYKKFPYRKIENNSSVFNFYKSDSNYHYGKTIRAASKDFNPVDITLDSLTKLHNTISLMIIRNDTILYENYKNSDTMLVSSFSLAKPIVTTLIGIALDEGKIRSIDDPITDYLTEFKNKPSWDKITIKDLLHHTSGIKFKKLDNLEYYWAKNLRSEILNLTLEAKPGSKYKYSSINPLLLGLIIERVTGSTISIYLQEKIWEPLGMEGIGYWSLDRSDEFAMEKTFCCLQGRTVDFAKVARLYLEDGIWNGRQIVSKQWTDYSTHSDTSGANRYFYNNNWGIGPLKYNSYYAIGLYGQFLYVFPQKKIIIVRFADEDLNYRPNYWLSVFLQIIDQL